MRHQLPELRQRFIDDKRKLVDEKEEKAARIRQAGKAEGGHA